MRTIDISFYKKEIIQLRRLYNDKQTFEILISFLIQNNLMQSCEYDRLKNEYLQFLNNQYHQHLQDFIDNVIMNYTTLDNLKYWEVNYEDEELIIYD